MSEETKKCKNCGHESEDYFFELADDGETIIYICEECYSVMS